MKNWLLSNSIFVFALLILGCNSSSSEKIGDHLPYFGDASFTPIWLDSDDPKLENFHKISSFSLINQNGKTISEETFDDKIYVVDFFFTSCPGICPKMTKNMFTVQEAFINDPDIMLVSHSVTPEKDSVPVLKEYAEIEGAIDGKWHLVTGDRKEIYDLGRQQYFIEEDLGLERTEEEFLHTENFVLIDKNKHIRGIYNGLKKTSIQQLIEDIQLLKEE